MHPEFWALKGLNANKEKNNLPGKLSEIKERP